MPTSISERVNNRAGVGCALAFMGLWTLFAAAMLMMFIGAGIAGGQPLALAGAVVPLVFVIVGSVMTRGLLGAMRVNRLEPHRTNWQTHAVAGVEQLSGSTTLRSAENRLGGLMVLLVFTLIWNAIVGVFLWGLMQKWQSGSVDWWMMLFMSPFVLVGFACLAAVLYAFMTLFNPRSVLTMNSGAVPLGGNMDIQWQLTGGMTRVDRFHLSLEAREEATYQRGTNTYTDRETFYSVEVVNAATEVMPAGNVSVTVPANLIHSFEAPNNKIVWSLKVHGEIARWPDLNEEFKIVVTPQPDSTASFAVQSPVPPARPSWGFSP